MVACLLVCLGVLSFDTVAQKFDGKLALSKLFYNKGAVGLCYTILSRPCHALQTLQPSPSLGRAGPRDCLQL